MKKYILTALDGDIIVTDENKNYMAQSLDVEEALAEGLSLKEMIEDTDGFMDYWIPVNPKYGWGDVLEIYSSNKKFEIIEDK